MLVTAIRQEEEIRSKEIRQKEKKLSLFANNNHLCRKFKRIHKNKTKQKTLRTIIANK